MVDQVLPLAQLAPEVGISPSGLYQAACRGELHLVRLPGGWGCSRAEALAYAETRRD
jgi:hypothetical protein